MPEAELADTIRAVDTVMNIWTAAALALKPRLLQTFLRKGALRVHGLSGGERADNP